jgi:hypothetical protein
MRAKYQTSSLVDRQSTLAGACAHESRAPSSRRLRDGRSHVHDRARWVAADRSGASHSAGRSGQAVDHAVREPRGWGYRAIQDVELFPGSLQYCTGDDCWSFDLATRVIAALPGYLPAPRKLAGDPPGAFTDGHGTTLAIADETHVEFCPRGVDARASCRSFK